MDDNLQVLHCTNLTAWIPEKVEGRAIPSYYEKLKKILVNNLGSDGNYLLAMPAPPNENNQVRWTTELSGEPLPFYDIGKEMEKEKNEFRLRLESWVSKLSALAYGKAFYQEDDGRILGRMLQNIATGIHDIATGVPRGQEAFLVDGRVVIAGWGGSLPPDKWDNISELTSAKELFRAMESLPISELPFPKAGEKGESLSSNDANAYHKDQSITNLINAKTISLTLMSILVIVVGYLFFKPNTNIDNNPKLEQASIKEDKIAPPEESGQNDTRVDELVSQKTDKPERLAPAFIRSQMLTGIKNTNYQINKGSTSNRTFEAKGNFSPNNRPKMSKDAIDRDRRSRGGYKPGEKESGKDSETISD